MQMEISSMNKVTATDSDPGRDADPGADGGCDNADGGSD